MDYPHPLEKLNADGTIDISDAYPQKIGDWDKVTINYGYRQFAPGTDEKKELTKILDDAWAQDLRYMTNQDTDSNPKVDQWSNGVDQADELYRLMKVRRAALNKIGEHTITRRHADGDGRRAAGADLHVSPLRRRIGGVDGRRPGLHLRDARRQPHADQGRRRRRSAQGARRAGADAAAVRADGAGAGARA